MLRSTALICVSWFCAAVRPLPAQVAAARNVEHFETVRTALGWRDNVMLSPFAPIGRAFGRTEVEAFLSWPHGDWRLLSLLNGDVLRYFSPPPDSGGEQQWFIHLESRWQHWPAWRMTLKVDTFMQDTVIDLSETEATRTILAARVRGGFSTFAPRITLPAGLVLEPLIQAKRVTYRDIPGNYDETKAGARLEWKSKGALAISAAWLEHRRRYAERQQYTVGGRTLKGTQLRFWQREGELKVSTGWTAAGPWTAAATVGRLENRDHASGFFDYNQQHARLEFSWQAGLWKTGVSADARRMDYLRQTVGAGIAPPPRVTDSSETRLRLERTFSPRWLAFAEHTWERNRSNEREFSYRGNTAFAGLQRDF